MSRFSIPILCCVLHLPVAHAVAAPAGPAEDGDGGGARTSSALNPAISFNALVLGSYQRNDGRGPDEQAENVLGPGSGITLQEAELIMSASVDPYFKADAVIALHDHEGEFEVDLEEVYVTALAMPRGLGLRAGKFYLPFGRHNLLHTHQYPFVQAPLVNQRAFGEEGFNETGAELSWLLPAGWYSQLVGGVGDGRNEVLFEDGRGEDLAWYLHFKNLWDLSEEATLELGGSGSYGKALEGEDSSSAYGFNATYKWRPARRSRERALELQFELIHADRPEGLFAAEPFEDEHDEDEHEDEHDEDHEDEHGDEHGHEALEGDITGLYLHARWQFARRWWLQGRYDWVENQSRSEDRWTALVAFVPTEFSALRLEYATVSPFEGPRDHQILAQFNFTIGSHPAHSY